MDVTFTKLPGRRYLMTVVRERGPELAPRQGPGYHDYLPHDAVHFLVEAEARLAGGAFGRIADGRNNIFSPADPALRRREHQRDKKRKPTPAQHADMGRSEQLAGLCQVLWEVRAGVRDALPEWARGRTPADLLDSRLVERILARLDEFAARWHALPPHGSVTLTWPGNRPQRGAVTFGPSVLWPAGLSSPVGTHCSGGPDGRFKRAWFCWRAAAAGAAGAFRWHPL